MMNAPKTVYSLAGFALGAALTLAVIYPIGTGADRNAAKRSVHNQGPQKVPRTLIRPDGIENSDKPVEMFSPVRSGRALPGSWEALSALHGKIGAEGTDELWKRIESIRRKPDWGQSPGSHLELQLVSSRLAELDPDLLLSEAMKWREPLRTVGLTASLTTLLQRDPEGVAIWFEEGKHSHLSGAERSSLITAVATAWTGSDLTGSQQWLNSLSQEERGPALNSMMTELSSSGRMEESLKLAGELSSAERNRALATVARIWSSRDPAAALAWKRSLSPEDAALFAPAFYQGWTTVDPAGAAADLAATYGNNIPVSASAAVAREWARRSAEEAGVWVASLPSGDAKLAATQHVASELARAETSGLEKWINSIGDERSTDAALSILATSRLTVSVEQSVALAGSMAPSQRRDELLERSLALWDQSKPGSARHWVIETNLLNKTEKERWIRHLEAR